MGRLKNLRNTNPFLMKHFLLFLLLLSFSFDNNFAQIPVPPPVKNNFRELTNYRQLSDFVRSLEKQSKLVKVETIGKSVQGRELFVLKFSSGTFGNDPSKIKVLILAQQHGNEQSGKEGALLLAAELLKSENSYLFKNIDLALVPIVNADGSEVNRRRNAAGMDLNRNHLIMTEPEVRALHELFDRYLFEATLDVHEYSPYGESWKDYGYRKNFDVTLGAVTNINIPESIRTLANDESLPFVMNYLKNRDFSTFTYAPGGPPGKDYIRHSTFDVNDGRQSFGIQNTFSFIQEGMNGKDDSIENISHRAKGQMTGMLGFLEFINGNKDRIRNVIAESRKSLLDENSNETVSIQSVHVSCGKPLKLPLLSYSTGHDTIVIVKDYRPLVRSLYDVRKPLGYLIPKDCTVLVNWVSRHAFEQKPFKKGISDKIGRYTINSVDSIDFEGDIVADPDVTLNELKLAPTDKEYIYLPTSQIKGTWLVLALEPKSMLGLVTYPAFARLLKPGQPFPVLRVDKKEEKNRRP